ncbi:MAG: hypothetical protein ACRDRX_20155 [Pseudonocardiaceae bacterium]
MSGDGQPHHSQRPVDTAPDLDEATRYLCAAAHLDEEFCDKAIAEYLVEPVRAIPPAPGVDSVAVLREAVAAQTRRRIRDGLLLALLALLVIVAKTSVIYWAAVVTVAIALQSIGGGRTRRIVAGIARLLAASTGRERRIAASNAKLLAAGAGRSRGNLAVLVGVTWIFFGFLFPAVITSAESALNPRSTRPPDNLLPLSYISVSWPVLLIGSLMLIVLAFDRLTVAKLMASSFQRDRFEPDAGRASSQWERLARSIGHDSFRAELQRVAHADENSQIAGQADVVVYRGETPFIGAGELVAHHVIALPLEPSEDERDPAPISVNDLHHHVAESLATLRSPSSLSPGRRLEQLQHSEQVLMPSDRLLFNYAGQTRLPVLPDLSHAPLTHLPLSAARALAEDPLEWARYYACFRVESWDRDLSTSCYLHIGTDQRMLYLEWTYCTLYPVREDYRVADRPTDSPVVTVGRSLIELIVLPASVPARLRSAFRRRKISIQRSGELIPDRYGAAQSIRELAADTGTQTYFQDADTERYINIVDRTLVRAVGKFLEERGYSVVEFMKIADSTINNYNIQGDVTNSVIGNKNRDIRMGTR